MLIDLAEPVLYAMWQQARDEGRVLVVDEAAVGRALADIDGYDRHVHLEKAGEGSLAVKFS